MITKYFTIQVNNNCLLYYINFLFKVIFDKYNEKRNSTFTDLNYHNQNIIDNTYQKKKHLIIISLKTYSTKIH